MHRPVSERILLIGDTDRHLQAALAQGVSGAQVTCVETIFDGIAELSAGPFSPLLPAAEPIERRPDAAVRAMRELVGMGRLVLFGHPTLELLSRKMMQFGADDYVITPAGPAELRQILSVPSAPMLLA